MGNKIVLLVPCAEKGFSYEERAQTVEPARVI